MADTEALTAEQIRSQMRGIRRDLRANVKGIVENAEQMFDWKSYVRSFPWVSLGVAAFLGYLVVPRRMKVVAYDKETLENFMREKHLVAEPPPPVVPKRSVLNSALALAGGIAVKVALSYATKIGTETLNKMLEQSLGASAAPPSNGQSDSRSSRHSAYDFKG